GIPLVEMGDRQNRDARVFCHSTKRFEHCAKLSVFVTVEFSAQIAADRIDDDERDVADFFDLLFKEFEVGLKVKGAILAALSPRSFDDMDPSEICAGGN